MNKLLTIDELAGRINIKKKMIYDLVYTKRIPYIKVGRLLRFKEDLIETWLQQRTYIPFDMKKQRGERIK